MLHSASRARHGMICLVTVAALAACDSPTTTTLTAPTSSPPSAAADDFERPDGPLGPNWSGNTNQLVIEGGEVGLTGLTGSSLARWEADAFGPDQFSEIVIGGMNGNSYGDFRGAQVFVRQQRTGTAWRYGFHYFSNIQKYQIKYDGGPSAETRILDESASVEAFPQPGDVFRIEVVGDTIRCFVNGGLTLSAVDQALSAGATGFVIGFNPGSTVVPKGIVDVWRGGEK